MKKTATCVNLDQDLLTNIKPILIKEDVSLSCLIRKLLRKYIQDEAKKEE